MRLDEYQWSRNPRGMHNKAAPFLWPMDRLTSTKMGWAKMVAIDGEYVNDIPRLQAANITPIIRIFRHNFGASVPDAEMITDWRKYIDVGVKWFEYYNEPNLKIEWPMTTLPTYTDITNVIGPMMENWLNWAEMMIGWQCYPAFPALSETVGNTEDMTSWLEVMMNYLADNHFERFRQIVANGLWVATHPYFYNHYYQADPAHSGKARPPEDQNGTEGGWHFEYPYDPISQRDKPDITAVSGPRDYPRGDPIGLIGMGVAFMTKLQEIFGGGAIPVVGTEGGITPVPENPGVSRQLDTRYPAFTWDSHAEATVACFNWIAQEAPPWMFGLTLWKEDDYWENFGVLKAVQRLAETPVIYKNVPPLEPLEGPGGRGIKVAGPAAIRGQADYHFIVMTPGFNTNWFFNVGKEYYEKFRPQIATSTDFIAYMSNRKSLGVTLLATPDMALYTEQQIRERWPNVWVDVVVASSEEHLLAILAERVRLNYRFG